MKTYRVKFRLKTMSNLQQEEVQARNSGDARKLIEAKYGLAFQSVFTVDEVKK